MPKRILMAVTPAFDLKNIQEKLEKLGYEHEIEYISGNTLHCLDRIDLVLLELLKGGSQNYETLVKNIQVSADVPVVLLTVDPELEDVQKTSLSGTYGWVASPFHNHELHMAIEISFSRHAKDQELNRTNESLKREIEQRKEVERKLKESRDRYQLLAENVTDVIWLLDPLGRFVYVSPSVKRLRGFTPEEVMDQDTAAAHTTSSLAFIQQDMMEVLELIQGGARFIPPRRYEVDQLCKDGSAVPTEVIVNYLFDQNGQFTGFLGVSRDISRRRRMEKELQAHQKKLESRNAELRKLLHAIEQSGETIVITNVEGFIEYANPRFEETTGYTVEEVIGKNPRVLKSGHQTPDFYEELWRTIGSGNVWRGEFRNKRKNGTMYWEKATITPVYNEAGQITHYIALKEDITRRKKAERALLDSYQRFAAVMDSMEAIMYVTDMDTYEILFINKFTRDLFGNIEGKICWQTLQCDQTGPCSFCTNDKLIKDGEILDRYTWEFKNTKTGKWYHVQDRAIPWIDGRLVRMEIATDITRLKEVEEDLRRSEIELKRINAAKDKFFSIIAHDLKNPLTGIIGFSDFLVQHFDEISEEIKRKSTVGINKSARQLKNLLENLLQWSRTQTGIIGFDPEVVELSGIISESMKLLRENAAAKQIEIISEVTAEGMRVNIDVNMITSVIRNLLSNAVKYTPQGGKVVISAVEKGTFIEVCVEDNGVGISEQNLAKLFRIDTVYSTPDTQNMAGSGLGLVLAREFVEKHGGTIRVESVKGKGSIFRFTLPKPL